jgi:hypothetical protein
MGLARVGIAALAVVLAFGLLIVGGVALWGALTNKDNGKQRAGTPAPSGASRSGGSTSQIGNTVIIHCLATQCPVFVAGPGPTDVQFNGNLGQNERRVFNETRLTVSVQDASTVSVTINGQVQPKGRPGEQKTYEVPPQQ